MILTNTQLCRLEWFRSLKFCLVRIFNTCSQEAANAWPLIYQIQLLRISKCKWLVTMCIYFNASLISECIWHATAYRDELIFGTLTMRLLLSNPYWVPCLQGFTIIHKVKMTTRLVLKKSCSFGVQRKFMTRKQSLILKERWKVACLILWCLDMFHQIHRPFQVPPFSASFTTSFFPFCLGTVTFFFLGYLMMMLVWNKDTILYSLST